MEFGTKECAKLFCKPISYYPLSIVGPSIEDSLS